MATNSTPAPKTVPHTVAKFVGHAGTKRILTKKDQDGLIGVPGVAKEDLVWPKGNKQIDVTHVDESVLEYLKQDESFTLKTVEVPVENTQQ